MYVCIFSADITRSTANLIPDSELNDDLAISSVNFNINNRVRRSSSSSEDGFDCEKTNNRTSAEISAPSAEMCSKNEECCSRQPPQPIVLDIEDLIVRNNSSPTKANGNHPIGTNGMCSTDFNCAGPSQDCQNLIQHYQDHSQSGLEPLEVDENIDEYQTMQHTVLLILLLCAMFVVSICMCINLT